MSQTTDNETSETIEGSVEQAALLTPIDPFPTRALPQQRFDTLVKASFDQLSNMVTELNVCIPILNKAAVFAEKTNTNATAAQAAQAAAEDAAERAASIAQTIDDAKEEADRAEDAATRAESARDGAEAVTNIGIATTAKAGLVKPDGTTLSIDANGVITVIGSAQITNLLERVADLEQSSGGGQPVINDYGLIRDPVSSSIIDYGYVTEPIV